MNLNCFSLGSFREAVNDSTTTYETTDILMAINTQRHTYTDIYRILHDRQRCGGVEAAYRREEHVTLTIGLITLPESLAESLV